MILSTIDLVEEVSHMRYKNLFNCVLSKTGLPPYARNNDTLYAYLYYKNSYFKMV